MPVNIDLRRDKPSNFSGFKMVLQRGKHKATLFFSDDAEQIVGVLKRLAKSDVEPKMLDPDYWTDGTCRTSFRAKFIPNKKKKKKKKNSRYAYEWNLKKSVVGCEGDCPNGHECREGPARFGSGIICLCC